MVGPPSNRGVAPFAQVVGATVDVLGPPAAAPGTGSTPRGIPSRPTTPVASTIGPPLPFGASASIGPPSSPPFPCGGTPRGILAARSPRVPAASFSTDLPIDGAVAESANSSSAAPVSELAHFLQEHGASDLLDWVTKDKGVNSLERFITEVTDAELKRKGMKPIPARQLMKAAKTLCGIAVTPSVAATPAETRFATPVDTRSGTPAGPSPRGAISGASALPSLWEAAVLASQSSSSSTPAVSSTATCFASRVEETRKTIASGSQATAPVSVEEFLKQNGFPQLVEWIVVERGVGNLERFVAEVSEADLKGKGVKALAARKLIQAAKSTYENLLTLGCQEQATAPVGNSSAPGTASTQTQAMSIVSPAQKPERAAVSSVWAPLLGKKQYLKTTDVHKVCNRFREIRKKASKALTDTLLTQEEFTEVLAIKPAHAAPLFDMLCAGNVYKDGEEKTCDFRLLLVAMAGLTKAKAVDRMRFAALLLDEAGTNKVSTEQLTLVLRANALLVSEVPQMVDLEEQARTLIAEVGCAQEGSMSQDAFLELVRTKPKEIFPDGAPPTAPPSAPPSGPPSAAPSAPVSAMPSPRSLHTSAASSQAGDAPSTSSQLGLGRLSADPREDLETFLKVHKASDKLEWLRKDKDVECLSDLAKVSEEELKSQGMKSIPARQLLKAAKATSEAQRQRQDAERKKHEAEEAEALRKREQEQELERQKQLADEAAQRVQEEERSRQVEETKRKLQEHEEERQRLEEELSPAASAARLRTLLPPEESTACTAPPVEQLPAAPEPEAMLGDAAERLGAKLRETAAKEIPAPPAFRGAFNPSSIKAASDTDSVPPRVAACKNEPAPEVSKVEAELDMNSPYDGEWFEGDMLRAAIRGTTLTLPDGFSAAISIIGSSSISMLVDDEEYHATLDNSGRLVWNDGDIWTKADRPDPEKQEPVEDLVHDDVWLSTAAESELREAAAAAVALAAPGAAPYEAVDGSSLRDAAVGNAAPLQPVEQPVGISKLKKAKRKERPRSPPRRERPGTPQVFPPPVGRSSQPLPPVQPPPAKRTGPLFVPPLDLSRLGGGPSPKARAKVRLPGAGVDFSSDSDSDHASKHKDWETDSLHAHIGKPMADEIDPAVAQETEQMHEGEDDPMLKTKDSFCPWGKGKPPLFDEGPNMGDLTYKQHEINLKKETMLSAFTCAGAVRGAQRRLLILGFFFIQASILLMLFDFHPSGMFGGKGHAAAGEMFPKVRLILALFVGVAGILAMLVLFAIRQGIFKNFDAPSDIPFALGATAMGRDYKELLTLLKEEGERAKADALLAAMEGGEAKKKSNTPRHDGKLVWYKRPGASQAGPNRWSGSGKRKKPRKVGADPGSP